MKENLKEGDVVVLNSGSPEMTFQFVDTDDIAKCIYWDAGQKKFQEVKIHVDSLSKA